MVCLPHTVSSKLLCAKSKNNGIVKFEFLTKRTNDLWDITVYIVDTASVFLVDKRISEIQRQSTIFPNPFLFLKKWNPFRTWLKTFNLKALELDILKSIRSDWDSLRLKGDIWTLLIMTLIISIVILVRPGFSVHRPVSLL